LAQRRALIRYYFHVEPKTHDELARMWGELFFALQFDGKIKVDKPLKG
jgi:hypothetical protein